MRNKGFNSERSKVRLRHHRHRRRRASTARRRPRTTRPPFRAKHRSPRCRINIPTNTHRRARERGRTHNTYSTAPHTHNLHSKTTFISPTTQIRIICRSPHPPRPIRHPATSRTAPVIRQFSGATFLLTRASLTTDDEAPSVGTSVKIWSVLFSESCRDDRYLERENDDCGKYSPLASHRSDGPSKRRRLPATDRQ